MEDVNPTFDGEAVKTQFTISFPQNVAKTRQAAGTVQAGEQISDFRGMDNIVLYPFAATAAAGEDPITSSSTKLGDQIALTSMIKPTTSETINNSIPASTLIANSNSVLYNDVTIPLGTGSFLFYGKAIDSGTDKFYNGSLKMINTSNANPQADPNPGNIAFDLDATYTADEPSSTGAALATYLSTIAKAGATEFTSNTSGWEATSNTGLKDLYDKFVSLKAGSSLTVQAAIQSLYTALENYTDDDATAVKNAITGVIPESDPEAHYATDNGAGTLSFNPILGNSYTEGEGNTVYFPYDVNLPDGAAYLTYNEDTNTFSQSTTGSPNTGLTAPYASYVYPASLYYYGNSGVKTSNASQKDLYDTAISWTNLLGSKDSGNNDVFSGNAVGPSTRSVAIIDPIQYAVGRLDMKVKQLPETMYDKVGHEYTATNGFQVTGILIGGQKQVKFDFTTNTDASDKTIYDNIQKSQTSALNVTKESDSPLNYTLALETVDNENTGIFVAVEFLNKGGDFEGADGVIPAGCKFYLVGELKPSNVTDGEKRPTGLNQVFKQDYKTIANFSISTNTGDAHDKGLGAAYNTIPDLRTPKLELGLSVDLEWQSGIQFDVTF